MAALQVSGWPGLAAGSGLDSVFSLDQQLFWVFSSHGRSEEHKRPNHVSTFKASAQITPPNIPLAKPSHVAKPKVRDGAVPSAHHHKAMQT